VITTCVDFVQVLPHSRIHLLERVAVLHHHRLDTCPNEQNEQNEQQQANITFDSINRFLSTDSSSCLLQTAPATTNCLKLKTGTTAPPLLKSNNQTQPPSNLSPVETCLMCLAVSCVLWRLEVQRRQG
jgi:hypothetical protein